MRRSPTADLYTYCTHTELVTKNRAEPKATLYSLLQPEAKRGRGQELYTLQAVDSAPYYTQSSLLPQAEVQGDGTLIQLSCNAATSTTQEAESSSDCEVVQPEEAEPTSTEETLSQSLAELTDLYTGGRSSVVNDQFSRRCAEQLQDLYQTDWSSYDWDLLLNPPEANQ